MDSGPCKIRILLVDDHYLVRVGLSSIINFEPDMTVVAEATSGEQAVELFRKHRPDVTLMDLRLPGIGGVEAMTAIRQEFPAARIIVISIREGDEEVYRAFQAGARSYLPKHVTREELLKAVRATHAGQYHIPPEVGSRLAERMPRSDLSPRELEVLELVVRGKRNKEIAAALDITEGTVKLHVSSILGKLGVHDRTEAVTTALQRGIVQLD